MRRTSWILGVTIFLGAAAASGQTSKSEAEPDLRGELAKLNQAVREIADLLAKQAAGQKLELLTKRIEVASARVSQKEQQLRSLKSEKSTMEGEKQELEERLREFQSRNQSETQPELQGFIDHAERSVKRLAPRIQTLGQEIAALEGSLATEQEDLRGWQRVLDRGLNRF